MWLLHLDEEKDEKDFQDFLYNLEGHEKSVNAVRFSPNGRYAHPEGPNFTFLLACNCSFSGVIVGDPSHVTRRGEDFIRVFCP